MRKFIPCQLRYAFVRAASNLYDPPVVRIANATFYRRQLSVTPGADEASSQQGPDPTNPPLFPNLTFSIPSRNVDSQFWAVVGPSNAGKTTFLEVLRGLHLCFPPTARTYPYLATDEVAEKDPRLRYPRHAIQYVGFNAKERGLSGMGTYMSARYESRREATDFSLLDFLKGNTQLNAGETVETVDPGALQKVTSDLRLEDLLGLPVSSLSNGQTRRARIAKALLGRPEVLLLDEPFMGLDPPTTVQLSSLLHGMAQSSDPRLLLSLRPQDPVPDWITHVLTLGDNLKVTYAGPKDEISQTFDAKYRKGSPAPDDRSYGRLHARRAGEVLIEMKGVVVSYGDRAVLGNGTTPVGRGTKPGIHWKVRRGQRWAVLGPNGSGKTTLLSLITSDHPQAYSQPVQIFSRHRLPELGQPGIPLFELQRRIGHASPEVHAFFPRRLSVRATLESAFADTPLSRPSLTSAIDERVSAFLRWFQGELNPALGINKGLLAEAMSTSSGGPKEGGWPTNINAYRDKLHEHWYDTYLEESASVEWADEMRFGELSFSAQRIALFLRAIIARPDIVVLDEAFSGLDEVVRDKCLLFLERGEREWIANSGSSRKAYDRDGITFNLRYKRDVTFAGLSKEQALIVVSHIKEEVPGSVRDWIYLPDASNETPPFPYKIGKVNGQVLRLDQKQWTDIWNLGLKAGDAA